MKYVYVLLALLALAGALEWHGHHRGYDDGVAATQQAAQADAEQMRAERDAAAQTLADVRHQLADQKAALRSNANYADAAIADRNRLQRQYDQLVAQRKTQNEEAAHANAACTGLVHLPVCPAVAERLRIHPAGHTPDPKTVPSH